MKWTQPEIPEGWKLVGVLPMEFPKPHGDWLNFSDDLFQATAIDGSIIDVGWHPEYDPKGTFVITLVHNRKWNKLNRVIHTRNPNEVIKIVQDWANIK